MNPWLIAGGYGAAWLITARLLFGWWRSQGMTAKHGRWCPDHGFEFETDGHGYKQRRNSCCLDKPIASDGVLAFYAMTIAAAWPVAVLAAVVRAKPPATPGEEKALAEKRQQEAARLQSRNAELERELGIRSDHA